jgi:prolipoprotein diacylglyceryltransferase
METSVKLLHWIPRILVILAILFVSMFALDSFSSERTLWQNAGAFLMHLVPSFVLTGILIVAWKWEKIGGIILTVVGIVLSILVFMLNFKRNHSLWMSLLIVLMICIPFVVAGVLFIISDYRKRKELQVN